jgi:exodeoxyribonuclease III
MINDAGKSGTGRDMRDAAIRRGAEIRVDIGRVIRHRARTSGREDGHQRRRILPLGLLTSRSMRIATWNVNSLKVRLPKVQRWLETASPDVLLMQETKLSDSAAPAMPFEMSGYQLAHHGEGRWNGVAIASRVGLDDVSFGFEGRGPDAEGARFISARCGGIRVISIYAPNGRALDSPFYLAKLDWFARLRTWLDQEASPDDDVLIGGDFNIAPQDLDVYDPRVFVASTHTSDAERVAFRGLLRWGLVDLFRQHHPDRRGRYTWWDYRAGDFHNGRGMRIDHLLGTPSVAGRSVACEIDRSARKGFAKGDDPPSDHAPLFVDLDAAGVALDLGWKD